MLNYSSEVHARLDAREGSQTIPSETSAVVVHIRTCKPPICAHLSQKLRQAQIWHLQKCHKLKVPLSPQTFFLLFRWLSNVRVSNVPRRVSWPFFSNSISGPSEYSKSFLYIFLNELHRKLDLFTFSRRIYVIRVLLTIGKVANSEKNPSLNEYLHSFMCKNYRRVRKKLVEIVEKRRLPNVFHQATTKVNSSNFP